MTQLAFVKPERISLRDHPTLTERWVQERIAEDPGLLGLGDVVVKGFERIQPRAGRLDLLLQDAESRQRYEVEIQLGATDESHIIRTIEYWDVERKRYPQYDHCAVLVAEDITGRFLNVIQLFNGTIPLIALQVSALKVGEQIALVFTKVLDVLERGTDEEDDEAAVTDRAYWEARGSPDTVALADQLLLVIREFAPAVELKYNKFYIGLAEDRRPNNFVIFRPQKQAIRMEVKLRQADEIQQVLDAAGLDLMEYDKRFGYYRLRLTGKDIRNSKDVLVKLMKMARERYAE